MPGKRDRPDPIALELHARVSGLCGRPVASIATRSAACDLADMTSRIVALAGSARGRSVLTPSASTLSLMLAATSWVVACSAPAGGGDDSVPSFSGPLAEPVGPGPGGDAPGADQNDSSAGANGTQNGAQSPGSEGANPNVNAGVQGSGNAGNQSGGSANAGAQNADDPAGNGSEASDQNANPSDGEQNGDAQNPPVDGQSGEQNPAPAGDPADAQNPAGENPPPGDDQNDGQDPPVDDLPPVVGCDGQFLCDDFEGAAPGGSPNAALWQVMTNYTTMAQTPNVQVSTQQARTGNQSVRVSGSAGRSGIIATLPTNTYYVRAWMFAETAPSGPVLAGFGSNGNDEVRFRLWTNSWATINSTVGDDLVPQAARAGNCPDCSVVPAGTWFCMEYLVDQGAQAATLWIDGQQAAVLDQSWANQPATPAMFLGSMTLGGATANVFIDDVVAGPDRIGCN